MVYNFAEDVAAENRIGILETMCLRYGLRMSRSWQNLP